LRSASTANGSAGTFLLQRTGYRTGGTCRIASRCPLAAGQDANYHTPDTVGATCVGSVVGFECRYTRADGAPEAPTASVYPQTGAVLFGCAGRSSGSPPGTNSCYGSTMSHTWYVTVEVRPGALPRPRSPRRTTTFETEAEAKNFARTELRDGRMVFAGTINPFVPRRIVSSHDISAWLIEE
jgi:hypothetical protein